MTSVSDSHPQKVTMSKFKDFCETQHYWTGFLTGIIVGSFFAVPIIAIVFSLKSDYTSPETEVITKYKECDIVRFAPNDGANYHYFLDCSTTKK